jgi:hypothetical protein
MNAQVKLYSSGFVTGWNVATVRVTGRKGGLKGYALTGSDGVLGFIETMGPHPRIEELLTQYAAPPVYFTARELMRDLLNSEDYRSDIYDAIVRVYYPEDFANV